MEHLCHADCVTKPLSGNVVHFPSLFARISHFISSHLFLSEQTLWDLKFIHTKNLLNQRNTVKARDKKRACGSNSAVYRRPKLERKRRDKYEIFLRTQRDTVTRKWLKITDKEKLQLISSVSLTESPKKNRTCVMSWLMGQVTKDPCGSRGRSVLGDMNLPAW